jgi:hypothetical protein
VELKNIVKIEKTIFPKILLILRSRESLAGPAWPAPYLGSEGELWFWISWCWGPAGTAPERTFPVG